MCSGPSKKVHRNVGHFHPGNFFFILTLHTLRQLLDWPLISFSTLQPKHGTCSSPSKKISQNFMSSPITRKSLIAQILERWLLVAKKVPYKFPNNIASKLSTLHAVNWWFVCQPKNAESSRSMQLFFRKFNKITKSHLSYVKFPASFKYVLEILISCPDLDLVFEISLRLPHILLISEVNSCPILMFQYSNQSLGPALQESELKLRLGGI